MLLILFLLTFSIGYIRETIFLVINTVIHNYPFPFNASYLEPPAFLYEMENENLIIIKWVLTFLFSIIFMGTTLLIVNFYFKSKAYNRITIAAIVALFLFALIISLIGIAINKFDGIYPMSRFVVGLLQSPLLTFTIFTLFYFIDNRYRLNE